MGWPPGVGDKGQRERRGGLRVRGSGSPEVSLLCSLPRGGQQSWWEGRKRVAMEWAPQPWLPTCWLWALGTGGLQTGGAASALLVRMGRCWRVEDGGGFGGRPRAALPARCGGRDSKGTGGCGPGCPQARLPVSHCRPGVRRHRGPGHVGHRKPRGLIKGGSQKPPGLPLPAAQAAGLGAGQGWSCVAHGTLPM